MSLSMLEQLSLRTQGLTETVKPFESWEGSPVKSWTVTMTMLTIGDLAEVAKLTGMANPMEATYLSKIYLLAKSLETINGKPVVTQEVVEVYNKEHNLSGTQKVDIFGYKVLFIRKWSEAIVNRLSYSYDQMQDKYLSNHLGKTLTDDMKAASVSGVDLSTVTPPQTEESSDVTDSAGNDDSS